MTTRFDHQFVKNSEATEGEDDSGGNASSDGPRTNLLNELLDDKAWSLLGLTGQEFKHAWYGGKFLADARPEVRALSRLMATGRWEPQDGNDRPTDLDDGRFRSSASRTRTLLPAGLARTDASAVTNRSEPNDLLSLLAWEDAGGTWTVVANGEDAAMIVLMTRNGADEVSRIETRQDALLAYLRRRPSSDVTH